MPRLVPMLELMPMPMLELVPMPMPNLMPGPQLGRYTFKQKPC